MPSSFIYLLTHSNIGHTSKINNLHSSSNSEETLQNFIVLTTTYIFVIIDQGIHKIKMKLARNEIRKKASLRNSNLSANNFFRAVGGSWFLFERKIISNWIYIFKYLSNLLSIYICKKIYLCMYLTLTSEFFLSWRHRPDPICNYSG